MRRSVGVLCTKGSNRLDTDDGERIGFSVAGSARDPESQGNQNVPAAFHDHALLEITAPPIGAITIWMGKTFCGLPLAARIVPSARSSTDSAGSDSTAS